MQGFRLFEFQILRDLTWFWGGGANPKRNTIGLCETTEALSFYFCFYFGGEGVERDSEYLQFILKLLFKKLAMVLYGYQHGQWTIHCADLCVKAVAQTPEFYGNFTQ